MSQSARTFIASKAPPTARRSLGGRRPVFWRAIFLAVVVGVGIGFVLARFLLYDQVNLRYAQLKTQFDSATAQSQADANRLQATLDHTKGQLTVEQSTRKALEVDLAAAQKHLGDARNKLAFFQQLFPPGPMGSVNIRAFDVNEQNGGLVYRVLLSRNVTGNSLFKGTMQFRAEGRLHGKKVKISLQPQLGIVKPGVQDGIKSGIQPAAQLGTEAPAGVALSFDQFQRREGQLALPQGFVPQSVTLDVLEGDVVKVSRTVALS